MKIHEFYYDQDKRSLYLEFSTKTDGDKIYRTLDVPFSDVEYYSTTIITEDDMNDLNDEFIVEFLEQYLKENDLPPEEKM